MAGYTPYEGWGIRGRAWTTLVRGQVLLNAAGELEQKPGFGQYLPEQPPVAPLAGRLA
jgi:hypothetical protein